MTSTPVSRPASKSKKSTLESSALPQDASYTDHALQILKQGGFRLTQPRIKVIQFLAGTSETVTVQAIKTALDRAGTSVDMVSIYRIIECLEANHLVHRLLSSGQIRKCQWPDEPTLTTASHVCTTECTPTFAADEKHHVHHHGSEASSATHCHHLIRCQVCDEINEVHCGGLESALRAFEQQSGYTMTNHYLEMTGICPQCQRSKGAVVENPS